MSTRRAAPTPSATAFVLACLLATTAIDPGEEAVDKPVPNQFGVYAIPSLAPGPPPTGAMPADVNDAARDSRHLPLPERMAAISEPMLGKPYKIDPLGEGAGIDPDPLARYDAYDCLTFVEEVLALAWSGDPLHAAPLRKRLRYGDKPVEYPNRRHFMELQWLPGNVADGFLVDTTAKYGATTHLERKVVKETWSRWKRRGLFQLTDDQFPTGTMALDVLPLDVAIAALPNLPAGAIVLTVRADKGAPMWTTHLGFLVPHADAPGRPFMRNASRRSAMRVLDEDFGWYMEHLKSYSRWPVAGIAVFEPVEQGPRRTLLGAALP